MRVLRVSRWNLCIYYCEPCDLFCRDCSTCQLRVYGCTDACKNCEWNCLKCLNCDKLVQDNRINSE